MSKKCCICLSPIEQEEPSILTMGGFGNPKYLCECCDGLLQTATNGRNYDEIVAAMDRLSQEIGAKNIEDRLAADALTDILEQSAKRAKAIKDGEYDFTLDEQKPEEIELDPDLLETEEDRALDEADARSMEKFDKVMNWLWYGVFGAVAVGFIYFVIKLCV